QELEQTYLLDTAGITATGNLTLNATAGSILNQGAVLSAGKDLTLTAAQDIDIESVSQERRVAVAYQGSSYSEYVNIHQGSQLSGETITITGKNQVNIQGAAVAAEKTIEIQG
ncbi:hemagglutinin repeat-containing protein, partial [Acetonema longum]